MKVLSYLLAVASIVPFAIATGGVAATGRVPSHDGGGRPAPATVAVVSPVAAIASVNQMLGAPHSIFQSGFE